jgi:lipopolysaccharide transport system ATP-binding protein
MSEVSPPAVRCRAVSKRFSRREIVPYQGFRTKLHEMLPGRRRDLEKDEVVWALRDVSFDLPRGRILGILGRNGSGKSVLMRVLAGVTKPTSGRSELRGSVSSILHLGAMLDPELTGAENIRQIGTLLRLTRSALDDRFDDIVAFAGIAPHVDSLVRGYSAGMQLRVAFAVAAYVESDVLLIDEALAVADEEFRARCVGRIRRLAEAGCTVVIVSHDLEMLEDLCDDALVVESGRLSAFGGARAVLDEYAGPRMTQV